MRLVIEVLLEFLVFFFFQLLHIYTLYESGIGITFNASSIFIACTGTYSTLSRTPPPVNENSSLDVFKSSRRLAFEVTGIDRQPPSPKETSQLPSAVQYTVLPIHNLS